ncbi:MAG: 2-hydroxyhepta-2,4-diene-1,7-dioate isomerase [Bacteroidetes bacterium HGW-Bacteroidetes-6]|nr:MAG: 2-hydroxyhepta-2,4-diene-1,7-dioate isomerase [Bacteroidetes bacterium HGW-Bacteroidetes-6]
MKIICIGRNYADHVKEMNNEIPEYPVFFFKHENAIIHGNTPFFVPDFSNNIHYECELVLRICKTGKNIEERFAASYFDAITLGIDFTARDIQKRCIERGEPWEIAKAFDNSAPMGEFIPISETNYPSELVFRLDKNAQTVQNGSSKNLIFSFERIIAHISTYITLKTGDVIFTGTPAGVGPVRPGDLLEGYLAGKNILRVRVK